MPTRSYSLYILNEKEVKYYVEKYIKTNFTILNKVLMEMGHGDEIVIADGNFPAASKANILVDCDGLNASELLDAILELLLHRYVCRVTRYVNRDCTRR